MKLTTILLIATMVQVSAAGFAQKISFVKKNATIKQVFTQINKQTGYNVFQYGTIVKFNQIIDVNFREATLDEVLKKVLENQPLEYTIEDKTIFINYKQPQVLNNQVEIAPKDTSITVTGRVFNNETGTPLEGATIKVKNGKIATTTNKDGVFKLSGIDAKATLIISYVGYVNAELKAAPNLGFINLKLSDSPLNEIQVIAYGTESKRFSTGSVSTVSAETIAKQPVTNVLLALQGQAPGLNITTESGAPGARVFVQVRGQNTFTIPGASTAAKPYDQPLFIIDGVPFAKQNNNINQLTNLASTQTSGGGIDQAGGLSPFNNINPSDIESVSILKDADATSIYGSEGSNGVILITTKKGRSGKTTFNATVNKQFNSSARQIKLLNTQQYLQLRKDAFAADGIVPSNDPTTGARYAPDLTIYDQNKYTNWQDVISGKTSTNTDIHATFQGGTGTNTFLISTGFNQSNFNFPGDYSNQRLTIHSAFHNTSKDNRLAVDLITDYGYNTNNSPGFGGNILLPPNTPDLLNPDGSLVWDYKGANLSGVQFYQYLEQFSNLQNHNFSSSLQISYKIIKGLSISSNLGYNRNTTIENAAIPYSARNPTSAAQTFTNFANSTNQAINIEPQLNYRTNIGKGVLTALLGGTYRKNIGNSLFITGQGYTNDNLIGSINGAATKTIQDAYSIRRYAAAFARISYNYAQKYIVQLTGRRDGSSNFGPGNQFGNFGSVGGAWIFSEESIVKQLVPLMSYGKLSANYGTSGSDGVSPYLFQTFWAALGSAPSFQGIQPAFPGNHYNPDYSWALKKSLNIAVDLGFFKDRVLLNATYYRNREGNQLAGYPLPIQTGFTTVVQNLIANIQNQGWEFSLNTKNIQANNFTWESNFNLSFNRNKLLSFPNLATSTYRNAYVIGQPISVLLGFRYAGIDPATGLPQFYDKNNNVTKTPVTGSIENGGDQAPVANRDVDYMGGLGNAFSYKQFRFDFFLQFSAQTSPTYLTTLYRTSRSGVNQQNAPAAILGNYWMNPGDQSKLLKLTTQSSGAVVQSISNFLASDAIYEKSRYLRLKTVSISYNLPESLIKKLHVKSGRLSLNAQNLLTFTNVEVGDPESYGNYVAVPLQRIISLGANFNF